MTEQIEIGGKRRPIRFGWPALLEYEKRTGGNALADFQQMAEGLQGASVTVMVNLVLCGLAAGYRSEKIPVDFDEYDVADWIGADFQNIFEQITALFVQSFEQGNGQAGPAKATTPAPQNG